MTQPDSSAPGALERPAPFLVMPEFLDEVMVERLLDFTLAHEAEFKQSKIGKGKGRLDDAYRRSSGLKISGALYDELKILFSAALPEAIAALGMTAFHANTCSLQLGSYNDGGHYRTHIDTDIEGDGPASHRMLTGVYYLHALPKRFAGGELRMHSFVPVEMGGSYADVPPDRNSFVLFPSWAPHEVRPVACPSGEFAHSRFSINCWFGRKNTAG